MPRARSPLSWDWDDDRFSPRREDYTEAELHRMDVARARREKAAAATANDDPEEER